jgi:hypothetical protein
MTVEEFPGSEILVEKFRTIMDGPPGVPVP